MKIEIKGNPPSLIYNAEVKHIKELEGKTVKGIEIRIKNVNEATASKVGMWAAWRKMIDAGIEAQKKLNNINRKDAAAILAGFGIYKFPMTATAIEAGLIPVSMYLNKKDMKEISKVTKQFDPFPDVSKIISHSSGLTELVSRGIAKFEKTEPHPFFSRVGLLPAAMQVTLDQGQRAGVIFGAAKEITGILYENNPFRPDRVIAAISRRIDTMKMPQAAAAAATFQIA
jgi:hypothetical protein